MSSKYYNIDYRFTSSLEDNTATNYISFYKGNLIEVDFDTEEESIIGKLKIDLIHISRAYDNRFPLVAVFDYDEELTTLAKYIYDYEQADFNEAILEFFGNVNIHTDICYLRQIDIIGSHRGQGIGSKVILDIFDRFSGSCGLFVVEAYPIQFNPEPFNESDPEEVAFVEKLNYESLSNDFEKSFYKLKAFFQKSGFHHIEGFDKWMFINPAILNDKLMEQRDIELE